MDRLARYLPLFGALKRYDRDLFKSDLTAGVTTAIMLIPQAMAYAMLAGLPPIIGLYASVVPLAIYSLFGSSRQLAVGPVAMVSLLVASGVGALATQGTDQYLAYAVLLSLMVGVIQLGMGVSRLGFLVNFLSHPVVAGFTSAAALIIGFSQLKHVLGVDIERSHLVHEILLQAGSAFGDWHWSTIAIALGSIATLMLLKRWNPRFPRFLVVVAVTTLAVWGLSLHEMGVAIVGDVPSGLPVPSLPSVDLAAMKELLPIALTISFVGFMESISVAKAFARSRGYDVDANKELKGLGLANLGGALFSAYPVTGGFSRTAVNAQAGAKTGVAGLVTAVVIALTLVFLTPLFYFLPKATLAAIIMTAVFGLVDVAEARHLWKVSRSDLALMGVTFLATLSLGIEQGILVGVAASMGWFIHKVTRPHYAVLGRLPGTSTYRKLQHHPEAETFPGTLLLRIDAPMFFGNTNFIKGILEELEEEREEALHTVVLDASGMGGIDASADAAFHDILDDYDERGISLYIAAARGPVREVFERSGFRSRLGEPCLCETVHEAVQKAEKQRRLPRGAAAGGA